MYGLIQKHKQLAALIIAIASISFLFWMFSFSDIKQMVGLQRCVAVVNGSCITLREFRYELLKYSDILENQELKSLVKKQVAYSLVNREALYLRAREMGIVASSREVIETIKSDPSFKEGGVFSLDKYKNTLEAVGLTPNEYEEFLKKSLTINKLIRFLSEGVYVGDKELEFQEKILSARFKGRAYLVTVGSVKVNFKPDEKELKKFYENNKDRFFSPEKRIYRVWSVKDKKKAHSLYSSLKKGKVPEGGKVYGRDSFSLPKDILNYAEHLSMDNRFTLTKSKDTYYVLYLESFSPKRLKSFEEAKEEVHKAFLESKKREQLEKKALSIAQSLESGKPVGVKPLKFDNSSVEEFMKLFNIRGDEVLRLVFSQGKVFGPYRITDGFVVLYIESRSFLKEEVKDKKELLKSLIETKTQSLITLFADRIVKDADVEINEEYLK